VLAADSLDRHHRGRKGYRASTKIVIIICFNKSLISFGTNKRKLPSTRTFYQIFRSTFVDDELIHLLLIAATVSFVLSLFSSETNGWVTGLSIYMAVLFMTTV
jgi:uncharacterized membrane protein YesL